MEVKIDNIVISCNRNDFFLTKICVASIRYFYPTVNVFLIKDHYNGFFDTEEIEIYHNIKIIDLGVSKYGWGAAKLHLLITKTLKNNKYLLLDSDIVFCGFLLDYLSQNSNNADFIVSADFVKDAHNKYIKDCYYNFNDIRELDSNFKYPEYVFNTGQLVITPGIVNYSEIEKFFDLNNYPRWKRLDIFPLVDQSLLNYVLPKKEQLGEIKIAKLNFMLWSESPDVAQLSLSKIKSKYEYFHLIHWAGALRTPYLSKMTRSDILIFFENFYYSKIPNGNFQKYKNKILPVVMYFTRAFYRITKKRLLKLSSFLL